MRVLSLVLFVSGCSRWNVATDPGRACLAANDGNGGVTTGSNVVVQVFVSGCASSSTEWQNRCEVVRDGDVLTVSAVAESRTPRSITLDCRSVIVECSTEGVPEGSYTLEYGRGSEIFEVPGEAGICVESAG